MGKKLVTGIELGSYLQILAFDSQTCILRLKKSERMGLICMENGKLLDAKTGVKGQPESANRFREEAVMEMLRWKQPEIEFLPLKKRVKQRIKKSLEFLLLESCRTEDESKDNEIRNLHEKPSAVEPHVLDDVLFGDHGDAPPAALSPADDLPPTVPMPAMDGGLPEGLVTLEDAPADVHISADTRDADISTIADGLNRNRNIESYLVLDRRGNVMLKKDDTNAINADFLSFIQFTISSYSTGILPESSPAHKVNFNMDAHRTMMVYAMKENILGFVVNAQAEARAVYCNIDPLLLHLQSSPSIL